MEAPQIDLTDTPDPAELAVIRRELDAFNLAACGIDDQRPIALIVRDASTQDILGGLYGRTSRGILFIDVLFLPPTMRGTGLGAQLLDMAEKEAIWRGCYTGLLHTNSFQAPAFYVKHGWREYARFAREPVGSQLLFFSKDLVDDNH